ncbi:MAG: hypothetical protein ACLGHC_07930 [Alphaproteobacteria bacterium]
MAAAIAALVVAAAAGLGLTLRNERVAPAPWPESERPELLVLTSLPIVFPESFSLDAPASPALKALQGRYRLRPISLPDRASLGGGRLLLMAQPRAQPAEVLVELDQWVRGGGRVLLLADPLLEWPSERPLGDVLRPPLAFADTGLLGHWGLRLDSPDKPGPAVIDAGGFRVEARSPGSLVATGSQCRVEADGLLARCRIGKGEATVIADADLLGPKTRENQEQNLGLVLAELERIER